MKRLPRVLLSMLAVFGGIESTSAAESSPALRATVAPSVPASPAPAKSRLVSSGVAALLRTAAPKFEPAAATPPPGADAPAAAPAEPDRSRNTIIRLPDYLVQEDRIRVPGHRDVLTASGELQLARRRYAGLNFGPLAKLNDGWALAMLEEDYLLERWNEMHDLLSLLPARDRIPAANEANKTLHFRPGDWVRTGGTARGPGAGMGPFGRQ